MITLNYYCNKCSKEREKQPLFTFSSIINLNTYQEEKREKHTTATPSTGFTSSFVNKSPENYDQFLYNTLSLGIREELMRPNNVIIQTNFVLLHEQKVGNLYINSTPRFEEYATKVVLPFEHKKTHCYSTGSYGIANSYCSNCGTTLSSSILYPYNF